MGWKWFRFLRAPSASFPTASALGAGAPCYDTTLKRLRLSTGSTWDIGGVPAGVILPFGSASLPEGYLACDGAAVSRTTYAELFAAIGTTWGSGNGTTTFNVPDLRGAAPAGVGTSTGYTQNETLSLATKYNDQSQSHQHQISSGGGGTLAIQNLTVSGGATGVATLIGGADSLRASIIEAYSGGGTPRTGSTTRGKVVGVTFMVKF